MSHTPAQVIQQLREPKGDTPEKKAEDFEKGMAEVELLLQYAYEKIDALSQPDIEKEELKEHVKQQLEWRREGQLLLEKLIPLAHDDEPNEDVIAVLKWAGIMSK